MYLHPQSDLPARGACPHRPLAPWTRLGSISRACTASGSATSRMEYSKPCSSHANSSTRLRWASMTRFPCCVSWARNNSLGRVAAPPVVWAASAGIIGSAGVASIPLACTLSLQSPTRAGRGLIGRKRSSLATMNGPRSCGPRPCRRLLVIRGRRAAGVVAGSSSQRAVACMSTSAAACVLPTDPMYAQPY